MPHVEFTDNYQDLSTENGFQFKFICQSCGNGNMSSWQANASGIAGEMLRGVGNIFGGVLGRAASGSYEIQKAVGGPAHEVVRGDAGIVVSNVCQAIGEVEEGGHVGLCGALGLDPGVVAPYRSTRCSPSSAPGGGP